MKNLQTKLSFLKKYSILDIIALVIFFTILFILAIFFLRKTEYTYITLRSSISDTLIKRQYAQTPSWYIQNIQVGMQEKNEVGQVINEVTDILYYPTNDDDKTLYITLKVRAVYNKNSKQYSYNGMPLLIGSLQEFKLNNIKVRGIIQAIGKQKKETQVFKVKGELENKYNENYSYKYDENLALQGFANQPTAITHQGLPSYLYTKITKDNLTLSDNHNQLIFKVTNIKLMPAYSEYVGLNAVKHSFDPERKKVFLEALVLATKVNNEWLFREQDHLQLGNQVYIHTPLLTLSLTIQDIQPTKQTEITVEQ